MVVTDGLEPIWCQGTCDHREKEAWSVYIRSAQRNDLPYLCVVLGCSTLLAWHLAESCAMYFESIWAVEQTKWRLLYGAQLLRNYQECKLAEEHATHWFTYRGQTQNVNFWTPRVLWTS